METFPLLQGKVAIVTGAAKGMGEATAKLFSEAKAQVVVADVDDQLGQKVVDEINQAGGEAIYVHTDISDSQQVQNLINETVSHYDKLDVAINNAALMPDNAPVANFDNPTGIN